MSGGMVSITVTYCSLQRRTIDGRPEPLILQPLLADLQAAEMRAWCYLNTTIEVSSEVAGFKT